MQSFDEHDLLLRLTFGMVVSGPSSSGKTTFVLKLLEHRAQLMTPAPRAVVYCYGEYGAHIRELEQMGAITVHGTPSDELLEQQPRPFLLVVDDLMLTVDEKWLSAVYTRKSHHMNFGVIFLTQDMFDKKLKVARINSQYIVLLRAPNAALNVRVLGSQLFPGKVHSFVECYNEITKKPYTYMLIDMHPAADPALRIRSTIFPPEPTSVYLL